MEAISAVLPPPRIEIKDIDAKAPRTHPGAEALCHHWMREVQIPIKPPEPTEAHLHRSVHPAFQIYSPEIGQIPLHDHIVLQEHNPPQLWVHCRQVEPKSEEIEILAPQGEIGEGADFDAGVARGRTELEPDAHGREVHPVSDDVEYKPAGIDSILGCGGNNDSNSNDVVGEDSKVVGIGIEESREIGDGSKGFRGERMGKKAESETMEGLGGGSSSDGARECAEAMGADELIAGGENGVLELVDLKLGVERFLGFRDELAGDLNAILGLLLQRPQRVLIGDGVGIQAGEKSGEGELEIGELAEKSGVVKFEAEGMRGVGGGKGVVT